MKVVIIGGFRFPFGDASAARYRSIATSLVECGVNVHVISQLPFIPRKEDQINENSYCYNGVTYEAAYVRQTIQRSYTRSALNIVAAAQVSAQLLIKRALSFGADAIYSDASYNLYLVPVILAARKLGIPVVNEVMEWYSPRLYRLGVLHPLMWDHEVCMRVTNKYCAALIVISRALQDYYRASGVRTLLVPSLYKFGSAPPPAALATSLFTIGYFGRPSKKDGIYDLIAILSILASGGLKFRCIIAGDDGRAGHLVKVRQIVAQDALLKSRVSLLGQVQQEKIPSIFAECHVLVLTRPDARFSRTGMPQKIPEYMALGRPVVVPDIGDIAMYVRHGVDGLVVAPNNRVAFAKALETIGNLPDHGSAMGVSAWKRGAEVFDVRRHAREIKSFFVETCKQHALARRKR